MLEDKARQIATTAHERQYRHNGTTPYITHPEAVVGLLKSIGVTDDDILSAAWLHDTIEDCGLTVETLERELNPNIARIVQALTRNVERPEYKKRILAADFAVQIVKLADVVHNCSTLHAGLPEKTIRNKVDDCNALYFELAQKIAPQFYDALQQSLKPWQASSETSSQPSIPLDKELSGKAITEDYLDRITPRQRALLASIVEYEDQDELPSGQDEALKEKIKQAIDTGLADLGLVLKYAERLGMADYARSKFKSE